MDIVRRGKDEREGQEVVEVESFSWRQKWPNPHWATAA